MPTGEKCTVVAFFYSAEKEEVFIVDKYVASFYYYDSLKTLFLFDN